jgi:predicted TIM-barrel fold metal-dependent hydrolase
MKPENHRIDIHYHIIPQSYVQLLGDRGITGSTFVKFPSWSPQKALKQMDHSGVATAITSLSTPGVWFGDGGLARRLSRMCNEFQAQMSLDYPGRFGSFAFLPLPDVAGALIELEYALDELGHDGVALLTDVDGHYLGDPSYEELFAELNRRGTPVFIHPHNDPTRHRRYELFSPLLEWPVHTTRATLDLLYSGRLARYPDIRYILAHGGGTVPFLAHRIAEGMGMEWALAETDQGRDALALATVEEGLELLGRLFYDTASPGGSHLAAAEEFVDVRQLLFGTDGGWTPTVQTDLTIVELLAFDGFSETQLSGIERDNALALFPRLKPADIPGLKRAG